MKIHDLIFQLRQVAANNAGNDALTYLLIKAAEKLADQKVLIESIELNEKLAIAAADDARNDCTAVLSVLEKVDCILSQESPAASTPQSMREVIDKALDEIHTITEAGE